MTSSSSCFQKGDLKMPPQIQRVTSVTMVGPPLGSSVLLNWLEGFVTELDFNSVPVGTVIDTHYTAEGVTLEALTSSGAPMGSVFSATGPARQGPGGTILPDPDPNDVGGPNSHTIGIFPNGHGGFNDTQGGVRATFKNPQLFVSIDARPVVDTTEFENPDPGSVPYILIFGVPPKLQPPHHKQLPLAKINFPLLNTDLSNFETWQTISFLSMSPTPNIGSIEFSCHYGGFGSAAPVSAYFDILRFAHHLPLTEIDDVG
jgi:hypothetical protein